MRSKYSMINSLVSLAVYTLLGVVGFYKISVIVSNYGSDMNGLQMFLTQFLRYLTLVETGFSMSVIYYLYKVFADKDYDKINQYYTAIKFLYKWLTILVIVVGIISIPLMFFFLGDIGIPGTKIVQIYFLMFLNLAIVFPFSPYYSVLQADQKMYVSKTIISGGKIAAGILSIILIKQNIDIIWVLVLELLINIIFHIYLKRITLKTYPNLKVHFNKDFSCLKKVPYIFPHVIVGVLVNQTDSLVLTKFESLFIVSVYSSYIYIITFLRTIINSISRSTQASFGNLFQLNATRMYESFLKYAEAIFFIIIVSASTLFISINSFISMWINESYVQSYSILVIFIFYYFHTVAKDIIHVIRDSTGMFKEGVFITALEGISNLGLSIILTMKFGMAGVVLGTIAAYYIVDLPLNAYVVYKKVFNRNFLYYLGYYVSNIIMCMSLCMLNIFLKSTFKLFVERSYIAWFFDVIIVLLINTILLFVLRYLISEKFREMVKIVMDNLGWFKTNKNLKKG